MKRKRKKKNIYWKDLALITVIFVIGLSLGLLLNSQQPDIISIPETPDIAPLSLQGFVAVNVSVIPRVITLTSGCYELTMVTTDSQTLSIISGQESVRGFRPHSHDLIADAADTFGLHTLMVKIESLREGTYFANLFIQQRNKILSLDSRPSDAIAIAVRADAPVFINQSLLEEQGEYIC